MERYLVIIRKVDGGYAASSPDCPGGDVFGPTLWEADRRFEAARLAAVAI